MVNVVVDEIAEAMNRTAAEYPAEVSEFDVAGLTPAPSEIVKPPRVAESPVNMECRLDRVISLGKAGHEHGLVLGEIVLMHVRDDIIDGHPHQPSPAETHRSAGRQYVLPHHRRLRKWRAPIYQPDDQPAG